MNEKDFASMMREREAGINVNERERYVTQSAFGVLMRKVYLWMTLALGITALAAYYVAHSGFIFTLMNNQLLFWGLIIAELGLVLGISAAINSNSQINLIEEFIINPYARYSAITWDPVTLFFDGSLAFASVIDRGTRFGLGVKPGIAIALTDHISFVTHLGFVGFDTFSPKGGGGSSTSFGVDFRNNCTFGVYYNF